MRDIPFTQVEQCLAAGHKLSLQGQVGFSFPITSVEVSGITHPYIHTISDVSNGMEFLHFENCDASDCQVFCDTCMEDLPEGVDEYLIRFDIPSRQRGTA